MLNWHALSARETSDYLSTDIETGLSEQQAEARLLKHGKNLPLQPPEDGFVKTTFKHLLRPLAMAIASLSPVVAVVAVNSERGGNWLESVIILLLIIAVCAERAARDVRARRSLNTLGSLYVPKTSVLRDGVADMLPNSELVPGDIIMLEAGDVVPADARLLYAYSLSCDESNAESGMSSAEKSADTLTDATAPVAKRINMIYAGCPVISGRCKAIVTATGAASTLGRAASLLGNEGMDSPAALVISPSAETYWRVGAAVCACLFALVSGLQRRSHDLSAIELIVTSVVLAFAASPSGLTSVISAIFARGALIMAKQGVVTRKLLSIVPLGGVSVVCTEKTGVLSLNRMSVERVWTPGGRLLPFGDSFCASTSELKLLEYGALCSDVIVDSTGEAIIAALVRCDVDCSRVDIEKPRVARIPFGSGRRLMTTLHKNGSGFLLITKGAPEVLLPLCSFFDRDSAAAICEQMCRDCLRVIAVAYRELDAMPEDIAPESLERDLSFAGLIGIGDIDRSDSAEAVAELEKAGVRVVMYCGEHSSTAAASAKKLGILRDGDEVLVNGQLAALSDAELEGRIRKCSVCARLTPEDKCRLIEAWQAAGETVAVTGSNIMDTMYYSKADASFSLGISGAQTTIQRSDMMLSDDSFSSVADAIRLCRSVCDNARSAVRCLLALCMGLLLASLMTVFVKGTSPLLAAHMLSALALGGAPLVLFYAYEPPDYSVMLHSARKKKACVPMKETAAVASVCGFFIAIVTLLAYFIGLRADVDAGRTMAFGVLCFSGTLCSVSMRSDRLIFFTGLRSNIRHTVAAAISIVAVALCMLFARDFFLLVELSFVQWLWITALSVGAMLGFELSKLLRPMLVQLLGLVEKSS